MTIGLLTLKLHLPGCASLKEKRRRLKPLLARLHKEFNVSAAELDYNDAWQSALIGCAMVANGSPHVQQSLEAIRRWIENSWHDVTVEDDYIELATLSHH